MCCYVLFDPLYFHNMHAKEKIGNGRYSIGLYYFEKNSKTYKGDFVHLEIEHIQDKKN